LGVMKRPGIGDAEDLSLQVIVGVLWTCCLGAGDVK
jgi:hypothetical protein